MSSSALGLAAAYRSALVTFAVAGAAAAGAAAGPDPASAKAEVPVVRYESAFNGYRKFEDGKVTSWRGANDRVHRLGGWKAFANDRVPDLSSTLPGANPGAPPAPAARGGHAGHTTTP
jgi:hypothetical protein